jgi:uncharacterized protein YjbJ (UPF0337 family)
LQLRYYLSINLLKCIKKDVKYHYFILENFKRLEYCKLLNSFDLFGESKCLESIKKFGKSIKRIGKVKERIGKVKEKIGKVKERFGKVKERFGNVFVFALIY